MKSVSVVTFQDCIEQRYTIRASCRPCQRLVLVDLQAMAQAGRAGETFIGRKWRCRQCGQLGSIVIWPPGFERKI